MTPQEIAWLLSRVDILKTLSEGEVRELARKVPDMHLETGQTLYTPSYLARALYLLLEGRVRIYKTVGRDELTLDVMEAGTMFGEAALAGEPEGTYAEAMEPSRIALLSLSILADVIRRNPEVGLEVARLLAERLHTYGGKMADMALKQVVARLASLLLWLAEIQGTVTADGHRRLPTHYTHEQLGRMIGAKRVAVTKAMSSLRSTGLVKLENRHMVIGPIEALERVAESS